MLCIFGLHNIFFISVYFIVGLLKIEKKGKLSMPTADEIIYKSGDIVGAYLLQERLSDGEFSFVFRAIDNRSSENVVVKLFPKSSAKFNKMYENEINALKVLKGARGVLHIKDYGEGVSEYFIVTDFLLEGSLRNVLAKNGNGLDIDEVLQIFMPIADAIDRIHSKKIIHRDLKPENILLSKISNGYQVFITDFGLSTLLNSTMTYKTEGIYGTPGYLSPEVWDANASKTKAVDIYVFGLMLYEAFEGKLPYQNINEPPPQEYLPFPEKTRRKVNLDAAEYLLRAINLDPEQRPSSAREIIEGIKNASEGNLSSEQKWIGRKLKDYRVKNVLRSGRMGITLHAVDMLTNRQVVLKAFVELPNGEAMRAYNNEKKALEKIKYGHGILTPQEIFDFDGVLFIVTDYQSGGNLRMLIKRKPKGLDIDTILNVFSQIAEAIDYIHENKVVHRDIKPENIVFSDENGKIKTYLTDFGISVTLDTSKVEFNTIHESGTPQYMAPELWMPNTNKTKSIDIYAFGIMLYEVLEGHVPFDSDEKSVVMNQHMTMPVPMPNNTLKKLGPDAKDILLDALEKNPEDRPKTAIEIIQQMKGQHAKFLGKRFGKYTIQKFIGWGENGNTYRAHNDKSKKGKFALKVLSTSKPVIREVDALKKIGPHDGILPILDSGNEDGISYVITEYLTGSSLQEFLQNYPKGMTLDEALKLFKPIAEALDYLHSTGIVHQNLKPNNVFLRKNKKEEGIFEPVITDYGMSKITGKVPFFFFESSGSIKNLSYVAPELLDGKEPSVASDIYSFGVMLYEALEGDVPYISDSITELIKQHLSDNTPYPKNLYNSKDIKAVSILQRALERIPERRPKSAQELISHLENVFQNPTTTITGVITEYIKINTKIVISFIKEKKWLITIPVMIVLCGLLWVSSISNGPIKPPTAVVASASSAPSEIAKELPTSTVMPTSTHVANILPPVPEFSCKLPPIEDGVNHTYVVLHDTSLKAIYEKNYSATSDTYDLYAVVYYNNREILEGKTMYHPINPVSLSVEKDWRIFLPSHDWIEQYKVFRATIPWEINTNLQLNISISGSSILSPLSLQIAKCFNEVAKTSLVQVTSNNTKIGLNDFCQGKADIFGANEEITSTMMVQNGCAGVELEKFEIASYAMIIFINNNNPNASDLQKNPMSHEELSLLLTSANSWDDIRSYWSNDPIIRYYPPLDSGEFEVVENTIFPNRIVSNIAGINEIRDKNLLIDHVDRNPVAVGIVDFDSYQNYQDKDDLIAIPVENISANSETINGDMPIYPLVSKLYLYVGSNAYRTNSALRGFIAYYLSREFDFLDLLGYLYPSKNGYLKNPYTVP